MIVPVANVFVKLAVPATVSTPVCDMLPAVVSVTAKFPPTVEAARTVARAFVRLALFAPVVFSETAPVSTFAEPSVIAAAPAV